jgi:hypothetical protein
MSWLGRLAYFVSGQCPQNGQASDHCGAGGAPLLDLEIIAQGQADEKDEDDRNNILNNQPDLEAARWHGKAIAKAGAEQKSFDLGVDGERPHERHGIAKRQHPNCVVIFAHVGRASRVYERRKDIFISTVKEGYAQNQPHKGQHGVATVVGKRPIQEHDGNPEALDSEPQQVARPVPPPL